jgi:hypothetical protein
LVGVFVDNNKKKYILSIFLVTIIFVIGLFGLSVGKAFAHKSLSTTEIEQLSSQDDIRYYLPLVLRNHPLPVNEFGVEIVQGGVKSTIHRAEELGVTWARYNGILWNEAEVQQGEIDWSALITTETDIRMISDAGIEPMVIVRGTPAWARMDKYSDKECGPIREDTLDDFADFMFQMVSKYSKPPYDVKYWELGNEPDVDPRWYPAGYPFGCWGDNDDLQYYGGQYYAEMLKRVYPVIKIADPDAKVILGGLLLLCDPEDPPDGRDCREAKFIEGVFSNGGGDYFDILAYHSYPYWYEWMVNVDPDLIQFLWVQRGGILAGKTDYLREVMVKYDIDKPLLMNEGGLMCGWPDDWPEQNAACKDGTFNNAQAVYSVRLYARTYALDVLGSSWYTLNGPNWRMGGLLTKTKEPLPAYNAIQFMISLLRDGQYNGQLSNGTLEGYEFDDPVQNKIYQIYWSNDDTIFGVDKPANITKVYDIFGNDITPAGDVIPVGFQPIYIEIIP